MIYKTPSILQFTIVQFQMLAKPGQMLCQGDLLTPVLWASHMKDSRQLTKVSLLRVHTNYEGGNARPPYDPKDRSVTRVIHMLVGRDADPNSIPHLKPISESRRVKAFRDVQ